MPETGKPKLANILSKAVGDAGALLATDPGAAETNAGEILKLAPGQAHALALLVSARRLAGDLPGARGMLEELAKAEPNLASIRYELALVLRDLGDQNAAAAELSRAVELELRHPAAWRDLGDLLAGAGQTDAAQNAYARHFENCTAQLRAMDPGASSAPDRLPAIEQALEAWLNQHPTDVVALRLLGAISMKLGSPEQAEQQFARAVELSPGFAKARFMLATLLNRRANWEAALPHAEKLLETNPDDSDYLNMMAEILVNTGQFERALACFEQIVAKYPSAANWMYYGHTLRSVDRRDECIAAYRHAISLKPDFGQAYWSLANLKTFRFEQADIDAMISALAEGNLDGNSRSQMHFALGKALEDGGHYERSFKEYAQANAVWRKGIEHDPDHVAELVRRSKAVFTSDFFRCRSGMGTPAEDPIFVLGLPRSGSTLVEQILASHSRVEGAGELPVLGIVAEHMADIARTQGETYPEILREKTTGEIRNGGEEYLERTQIYRKLGRVHFIDKMPSNFHHLGLLLLILPKAKVIDARRHPLGTGLANFKQFYPQGQTFTFDLTEFGRYYRDYVELMAHFDEVLPGRIHRVFYEQLVSDTENQVRALLNYCGLPFEESCLRFHETKRAVMTASADQVRQPLFTDAVAQWRNYEAWLGPLKAALGDVLASYPAAPKFAPVAPFTISWANPTARFD